MKRFFYEKFNISHSPLVIFCGDKESIALYNILAEEAASYGKHVIMISMMPEKYPIEGKVLVCDETEMLIELIRNEEAHVIYLAKKIEEDILMPFSFKEIKPLIRNQDENIQLFIKVSAKNKPPAFLKAADVVCTLNFNIIREEILQIYSNLSLTSSGTAQKKFRQKLNTLIESHCPLLYNKEDVPAKKTLFISQVKTLLDENLIIPIGRDLKKSSGIRILYGNINQYQLKEI